MSGMKIILCKLVRATLCFDNFFLILTEILTFLRIGHNPLKGHAENVTCNGIILKLYKLTRSILEKTERKG